MSHALIFSFCFGLDRITKYIALVLLSPGVKVPVASLHGIDFEWLLTTNEGAAWGVLVEYPHLLLLLRITFVAALFAMYTMKGLSRGSQVAMIMVCAGACGNIVDTFVWGHVIDMIHVNLWGWDYPVFNVADICICIGALTFLFSSSSSEKQA